MTDTAEGVTPVRAFLAPLNLTQYGDVFKSLGYDDPAEFAKFDAEARCTSCRETRRSCGGTRGSF